MENLNLNSHEYTQEDFDKVKELFKEKYANEPFKFELADEHPRELFFIRDSCKFKISEDELKSYMDYQSKQYSQPFDTCLRHNKYFEQIISLPNRMDSFFFQKQNKSIEFQKENIHIEISVASMDFQNHHRFSELSFGRYNSPTKLRMLMNDEGFINLNQLLYQPLTVKVFHEEKFKTIDKISNLIESCLFDYAVQTGIMWELQEILPNYEFRGRKKIPIDNINNNGLIKRYEPIILQYFKQGMLAENNPVYQFLSFYHVLEYFFVIVSDEKLYNNLRIIINQPNFNTIDKKNLDKIIKQTKLHQNMTDETQMLKEVLQKYITDSTKEELLEFIQNYPFTDSKDKSWLLMNKNDDFGKVFCGEKDQYQAIKIDNKDEILAQCARRIKIVRNALVHSSDRHERQERFIPTRTNKLLLEKEVPLVKFLAEQIIIASANVN